VSRDGRREPLDVYQRLVNANFNLNVKRAPLVQDFESLALDSRGVLAFRRFRQEHDELQRRIERELAACWRIAPAKLKANIKA
jgi:arachidonate 15-lipoxygenase